MFYCSSTWPSGVQWWRAGCRQHVTTQWCHASSTLRDCYWRVWACHTDWRHQWRCLMLSLNSTRHLRPLWRGWGGHITWHQLVWRLVEPRLWKRWQWKVKASAKLSTHSVMNVTSVSLSLFWINSSLSLPLHHPMLAQFHPPLLLQLLERFTLGLLLMSIMPWEQAPPPYEVHHSIGSTSLWCPSYHKLHLLWCPSYHKLHLLWCLLLVTNIICFTSIAWS